MQLSAVEKDFPGLRGRSENGLSASKEGRAIGRGVVGQRRWDRIPISSGTPPTM